MANVKNTEVLYREYNEVAPIGLIAMRGTEELAARINNYLIRWADRNGRPHQDFLIENECPRFSSGDAKGLIKSTVRGKDLFILIDVGNYSCSYKFFDKENHMSPDDHYADLKRIIQAASGKPHRINVIMPLLYGGRQHRRSYRESLDCAFMLQELRDMGVENVIPSYQVLKSMFGAFPDLVIDKDHFMVISPDEGALSRNMFYASVLEVEMGMFYKRRDYATIVNGRNPIVAHEYLGTDVEGKTVFVADDIISSGESMLDIATELKKRSAKRFFAYATYGIFTNGLAAFDKAYEEGMIDAVFSTNLTYRTPELLKRPWYKEVDVSKYIAYFIACINHDTSISNVIDPHEKIKALLREHRGL